MEFVLFWSKVPENVRTKLNFLLARLLDIAPHHFEVIIDGGLPQPHLCGWTLLHRWNQSLQFAQQLAHAGESVYSSTTFC